ncbi:epoxide hydrolase [Roridomyces roridus]|uniref:Epoxide hydrolase n=1 Tax=Roridomyces roridus TaxID=1738132 RepID=A0AAD7FVF3_9AGAR|nr:epoxide hydrolase [Roridomyces roridus]
MGKIQLVSGHTWTYIDANPEGQIALLCLHGFPDLSYGYRHQIGGWARAGFRVIVPDMLGYGGSDAPIDVARYTTKTLSTDLDALLTALGIARVVLIGHDWGSFTAGRFALWYPERLLALALFSVPFTPPSRGVVSLEHVAKRAPNLGYQLFLASPQAAPTLEANLPYFLTTIFAPPHAHVDFTASGSLEDLLSTSPTSALTMPSVLSPFERDVYLAAFRARGMTGPTNYYRTTRLRAEEELHAAQAGRVLALPSVPVLAVHGAKDATVAPAALEGQRRTIPPERLTERVMGGVGHWVLVEGVAELSSDAIFNPSANPTDPLAPWRDALNAGSWKDGKGDGGVLGRMVVEWLRDVGVTGQRAKM